MKHLYIIEATSLHDTLVTCAHIYGRKEAEEEKRLFQNCRHDMHNYKIRRATAEEQYNFEHDIYMTQPIY